MHEKLYSYRHSSHTLADHYKIKHRIMITDHDNRLIMFKLYQDYMYQSTLKIYRKTKISPTTNGYVAKNLSNF